MDHARKGHEPVLGAHSSVTLALAEPGGSAAACEQPPHPDKMLGGECEAAAGEQEG